MTCDHQRMPTMMTTTKTKKRRKTNKKKRRMKKKKEEVEEDVVEEEEEEEDETDFTAPPFSSCFPFFSMTACSAVPNYSLSRFRFSSTQRYVATALVEEHHVNTHTHTYIYIYICPVCVRRKRKKTNILFEREKQNAVHRHFFAV